MAIDVTQLSKQELESLIQNHRDKGKTDAPLFAEAIAEQEKRTGKGLDFDKSFAIIREAAKEGRFVSYKELAGKSEANWGQVHYAIGGHLWRLVEYAHRKGWPMLSAIVVNKPNVETGSMDPPTLAGFIKAAKLLGYTVADDEAFLRDQQMRVFEWAKQEA